MPSRKTRPLPAAPLLAGAAVAMVGAALAIRKRHQANAASMAKAGAPFDAVNDRFHEAYDGARTQAESRAPALVVLTDILVLCREGDRETVRFIPPSFHVIKSVAHGPLALFALLHRVGDGPLERGHRAGLAALRTSMIAASEKLAATELDGSTRERLQTTLAKSLELTDRVLADGRGSNKTVGAFARHIGPALLEHTDDATQVGLAGLDEQMRRLLARLSAEERQGLEVVVTGDHQARVRSLAMQYFEKLFDEPEGAERRVTFAEGLSSIDEALALVGKRRLDRAIASAFFGDPTRLQRDVLGDAVRNRLEGMELPCVKDAVDRP